MKPLAIKPLTQAEYREFNETLTKHGKEGEPMTYAFCLLYRHARMRDAQVEKLEAEVAMYQQAFKAVRQ